MCFAVFVSVVFTGWLGGAPGAVILFIPNAFSFFLVYLNCKKKWHLQLFILTLFLICAYTVGLGYLAIHSGDESGTYVLAQHTVNGLYLPDHGLSFINDPNDFAQLLVSLIPLMFFFWRKNFFTNILFVIGPVAVLLFGMYLTHSRGAIVATLAICILAGRRKIGTIPSLILAAVLFAGFTAVGWSGGREIDVEAGEDRLEAWSAGLQMIKSIRSQVSASEGTRTITSSPRITASSSARPNWASPASSSGSSLSSPPSSICPHWAKLSRLLRTRTASSRTSADARCTG